MLIRITAVDSFLARLRKLARKYPSVLEDVDKLSNQIRQGEFPGKLYRRVGGDVYQVRLPNRSARRGKSAGFRVLYHVHDNITVTLIAICLRSKCHELTEAEIRSLLQEANS